MGKHLLCFLPSHYQSTWGIVLEYLFYLFPSPQACKPLQGLSNSLWDPWNVTALRFHFIPSSSNHSLHYRDPRLEVEMAVEKILDLKNSAA